MSAQLEVRDPKKLGCPQCGEVWKWQCSRGLLTKADKKRWERLVVSKIVARYSPADPESLRILIEQKSRICPHCAKPFQHTGGCGEMVCGHCCRYFPLSNAPTVEEAQARYESRLQG